MPRYNLIDTQLVAIIYWLPVYGFDTTVVLFCYSMI